MVKEKQEACQLYIEQEIDAGLEQDLSPAEIARKILPWLEKLFEVRMKHHTLEVRAGRRKQELLTSVSTPPTPQDDSGNQDNKKISMVQCKVCHKMYDSTSWDISKSGKCPYCFKGLTSEGKPRQRAPGGWPPT